MSNTSEHQSPFGPGFIAACIVVGAVLICGLAVIFVGRGSSSQASTTRPLSAGTAAQATDDAAPAARIDRSSETAGTGRSGSCTLPAGDQTVPTSAPAVDGWEVSRRVVVPRSASFGPGKTDPDGFRRCFANSPTGAVFAAYNAIAAIADQTKLTGTLDKLMVPGPATESLVREAGKQGPSGYTSTVQLAGYRIVHADRDRVTVMLAMPVQGVYMSASLTLVWVHGDWRVQPPQPGAAVGAPFAQHRNLSDFVKWSGI